MTPFQETQARLDGIAAGRADRRLGTYNAYARACLTDPPSSYAYHYALGYATGQQEGHQL
jgi:hypothetical protein